MRRPTSASLILLLLAQLTSSAWSQEPSTESMRPYVLKAVSMLYENRKLGGYDIHHRFTQDLNYGQNCCINAYPKPNPGISKPLPTMCVAAVLETIVESINIFGKSTGDTSFERSFPMSRVAGGTKTGLLANVFQFEGTDSPGTGYVLSILGLGREIPFQNLNPGDFITFNRSTGRGHAVVFMGFLSKGTTMASQTFSNQVVGFRYFSAQGQGRPDGGFGYRNAYFINNCPSPRGRDDDCNIIGLSVKPNGTVTQDRRLFNTGEMFTPRSWNVDGALKALTERVTRGFEEQGLTRGPELDAAVDSALRKELNPNPARYVDGSEQ